MKCIAVISCFFFGQLSASFLGPCCPAPLYCIAVHDCLMLIEQINDDDDYVLDKRHNEEWISQLVVLSVDCSC